ncbi:MAG: hypothetical protein LBJ95_01805 [Oscillospiraceae bacterium]|jgi:hypothetical protein|nr:hypothetical protein [Oscillospiraceae bacterium]
MANNEERKGLSEEDMESVSGGLLLEVDAQAMKPLEVSAYPSMQTNKKLRLIITPNLKITDGKGNTKEVRSVFIQNGQWRADIKGGSDIDFHTTRLMIPFTSMVQGPTKSW